MRALGPLLFLLCLAGAAALRMHAHDQGMQLGRNELLALEHFATLHRAGTDRARESGAGHPGLAELAASDARLELLPELSTDPQVEYARDDLYMYGLARSAGRDDAGQMRPLWVLRAWPLHFGRTGDLEYHVDQDGVFYMGQNELGRSGAEVAFPPPFPQPQLVQAPNAAWWRAPLPPAPGGSPAPHR